MAASAMANRLLVASRTMKRQRLRRNRGPLRGTPAAPAPALQEPLNKRTVPSQRRGPLLAARALRLQILL
eukprot:5667213-Prymnesium_polylepis.1